MCRLIPKINRRLICDHSLEDTSVCAAAFTTVFSLIGMGIHFHGMNNPEVTQISYYHSKYHTAVCIVIVCLFASLFVSSIIFAIGMQKKWHLLYLPWIVTFSLVTVLMIVQLISLIIDNFLFPHLLIGIQAGVNIFAIWIGCNFYEETRETAKDEKRRLREQRSVRDSLRRFSDSS